MAEEILISAQRIDTEKVRLYNEFYRISKEDDSLVSPLDGSTTVEYWRQARDYVESRLRTWLAKERERKN